MEILLALLYPSALAGIVTLLFFFLRSQEGQRAVKIAKTNLTPVEDIAKGYAAVAASVKQLRAARTQENNLYIERWEKQYYSPEEYAKVLEERNHQKMLDEGKIKAEILTPVEAKHISAVDHSADEWVPLGYSRKKDPDEDLSYTQRRVQSAGAFVRQAPDTKAATYGVATGNSVLRFDGYVRGESVAGNDVWFVYIGKKSGLPKYVHSIATTDRTTKGLPDMTPYDTETTEIRNAAGEVCVKVSDYIQLPVAEVARRVSEEAHWKSKYNPTPKKKIPSTIRKSYF